MDDLIYIILLIGWVLFAFYRKSAKNKAAGSQPMPKRQPGSEPMPLPTLEDILLGRQPEPEPEPEPVIIQQEVMSDGMSPVLKETAFEREYNLKGISSIEEMDKPGGSVKSKAIEKQDNRILLEDSGEEDFRSWVDLRQAVIYSEILNRPYA